MGQRGPIPKPTRQRILEGKRAHRPLNKNEPEYRVGIPKCPAHLGKEAKAEWRRLAPMLDSSGILTTIDAIALGNLCQAYVTMQLAQAQLDKTGLLVKTQSGFVQQSPLVAIVSSSMEMVNRLCREFGLTPSSRSRLSTDNAGAPMSGNSRGEIDAIEEALSYGYTGPLPPKKAN
jgi:P27 family predicted phage terminase small subunit